MKKFFAVPLAVVFIAACSDSSTAPSATNLTPSYAKPTPPPADACATGCSTIGSFSFEGVDVSGGATLGTELQPGAAGVADAPTIVTSPVGNEHFVGRFDNTRTMVVVNVPSGFTKYSLAFNFYTIGSWDGRGKQAQHGVFDANVFDISYVCGTNAPVSIFKTSFSNQLTVQQDYPLPYLQGGNKAGTGSIAIDALGYATRPDLSNTPQFRSFGDATYLMNFSGTNPCGTAAIQFQISTSNPTQQSVWDESWGVDNVIVKAG